MAFIREAVKLGLASLAAKADKDLTDEVQDVAKFGQFGVGLLAVTAARTKTKLDDAAVADLQKLFSSPKPFTALLSGNLVENALDYLDRIVAESPFLKQLNDAFAIRVNGDIITFSVDLSKLTAKPTA